MVLVHALQLSYQPITWSPWCSFKSRHLSFFCTGWPWWDRFTSFCIEHHGFCYREDVNRPQILDTMHTMWILQETSYHLGAMMMSVLHQVLDFYGVIMGTTDIFVWGQGLRSPLNTVHSMIAQASGRLQGSLWCLLEALHCVVAFSSMVKVWEESLLGLKENCLTD
jgi:hypothetical protein